MNDETAAPERSPDRRSGRERRAPLTHSSRAPFGKCRRRGLPDRRSDSVPVEVETVSRTPIADALHEAYMKGFNDATMRPGDPMDEDAFTEAGIALSRMYTRPPEPISPESVAWMDLAKDCEVEIARLREALEKIAAQVDDEWDDHCGVLGGDHKPARPHEPTCPYNIAVLALAPTPEHGDDDGE